MPSSRTFLCALVVVVYTRREHQGSAAPGLLTTRSATSPAFGERDPSSLGKSAGLISRRSVCWLRWWLFFRLRAKAAVSSIWPVPAYYVRRAMSSTKARSSRSRSERTEARLRGTAAMAPVSVRSGTRAPSRRFPGCGPSGTSSSETAKFSSRSGPPPSRKPKPHSADRRARHPRNGSRP